MIAFIPALMRLFALVVKYGPTAVTLVHQAIELANQVNDDKDTKTVALAEVAAAVGAATRKERTSALKDVVAGLK